MLDWLVGIKDIIDLSESKRNMLIGYILLVGAIWFLYNENQSMKEDFKERESELRQQVIDLQNDCDEQINLNRVSYQNQFTNFVIETNERIDSLYSNYSSKIRKYNESIKDANSKLKELENKLNS